jgi:hypothetical protein
MALLNAVIDLSHHNTVTDFNKVKNDGILELSIKRRKGCFS